ncbi:MAG: NADH:flavin oxidoreductase [Lachnospiraceae bacterium]|nr:NADH:flavin oxidoreductase [Lachnospiraceae bacterium]
MGKTLSDKVKIGNITTKNRICVPPMVMFNWSDDRGLVTEKSIKHYGDMAKGGAGLIIAEATAITPRGRLARTNLGLWEDGQIEGFKRLAEVVHKEDCPFFVQLLHAGVNGVDPEADTCSDYEIKRGENVIHGHEMSKERIKATIDDFVQAALRAQKAGLDGIELHGCHSYLISQFFSNVINKRTDEYGDDKSLFAKEILKACREACGDSFAIGIRLGAFEPDLAAGMEHAKAISNLCDFMDISYGFGPGMKAEKPEDFPYKEAFYGAMQIKKELPDMPIFGVDSIKSGEDARGCLELTNIDMIDVGRGFLVNPDFANDALAGRDTGRCLNCKRCYYSPRFNDETSKCAGAELRNRTKM